MKIAVLESLGIDKMKWKQYVEQLESAGHEICLYNREGSEKIQIERAKDADVIIVANMPLSGKVIKNCPTLKFIDVAFTGVDHIDLKAAKECGVAVSNASGYATQAVSELALGMMLSLLRNMREVEARCRDNATKDGLVGTELGGKTVGIVGVGKIGMRTAQLCKAFGCTVLGTGRNPGKKYNDDISRVSLEELLQKSDIVTLHCPLTDETRGLISRERISLMKKGAILINTARGAIVDSEALADALNSGRIGGAGIDVFESEPPIDRKHCLMHCKNTLVTPHIAFASKESMELRADIVFDNLKSWMNGKQKNIILSP